MKKEYLKPTIEVETYTLDASIAANCRTIISMGPGDPFTGKEVCDEFGGSMGNFSINTTPGSFYQNSCACYYSAGGQGYFTS